MTIQEIQGQLKIQTEALQETQRDLEAVLSQIPEARTDRDALFNSKMLEIVAIAAKNNTKEPTEGVKKAMCETATDELTLQLRVLEYREDALKVRLKTITSIISVYQTQGNLLREELALSRYGRDNQT